MYETLCLSKAGVAWTWPGTRVAGAWLLLGWPAEPGQPGPPSCSWQSPAQLSKDPCQECRATASRCAVSAGRVCSDFSSFSEILPWAAPAHTLARPMGQVWPGQPLEGRAGRDSS